MTVLVSFLWYLIKYSIWWIYAGPSSDCLDKLSAPEARGDWGDIRFFHINAPHSLLYFSKSAKATDCNGRNICCDGIIIDNGWLCQDNYTSDTADYRKIFKIFITRISSEFWHPSLSLTSNHLALTGWLHSPFCSILKLLAGPCYETEGQTLLNKSFLLKSPKKSLVEL